nr:hypothetical protein [Tanacetum cinerariifolium]
MNGNVNNLSSPIHQDIHKIFKDEIVPIVNQVDTKVQNFKNNFMKEAVKFVRYFKSLAKEADSSLDKITVLEKENERLLRAVVSQDIMSIVLNNSAVETSYLQTELDRIKKRWKHVSSKKKRNMLNFGMIGTKNVMNANMTKFRTIKLIMTCKTKLNGCKLSWEISMVIPNISETNALSPVTSNSAPST